LLNLIVYVFKEPREFGIWYTFVINQNWRALRAARSRSIGRFESGAKHGQPLTTLDEARHENKRRIGGWNYSRAVTAAKMAGKVSLQKMTWQ